MWAYPITSLQVQFFSLTTALLAVAVFSMRGDALKNIREKFRRLANRPYWSAAVIAGVSLLLNALFTTIRFPLPWVHDEYSYLLAADTFANFRFSNPAHPLWEHFESFHILATPSLVSKYPPGNGLVLALGQLVAGHPIVGVWLGLILAQLATYWMLRAWTSPSWALFGGLALAVHAPMLRAWGQTYWGGAVAMLGGALLFGALRRIWNRPRYRDAVLLGLGAVILANTRPAEGFLTCLPVAIVLVIWLFRSEHLLREKFLRVGLPATAVGLIGLTMMGWYNLATTGQLTTMPYQLHDKTYSASSLLIWKTQPEIPHYNHREMEHFYTKISRARQAQLRKPGAYAANMFRKIYLLWDFFPLGLGLGFLALPLMLVRDRWIQFAVLVLGMIFAVESQLATSWMFPHYLAPVAALFYAVNVAGLRRMFLWGRSRTADLSAMPFGSQSKDVNASDAAVRFARDGGRPSWTPGRLICRAIIVCLVLKLGVNALEWTKPTRPHLRQQLLAKSEMDSDSKHLVIVSYAPEHSVHDEYVYNSADIDNAHVVWARDMGPAKNERLIQYFSNRKIWRWHVAGDDTASWERIQTAN